MWFKSADGTITMLDLESRRPVRSISAGISIPDALAVAPDGRTLATLRFDEKIFPTLVEVRDGKGEILAAFGTGQPVPHSLDFSPDGKRLIMDRRSKDGASDLWIFELATRTFTRLTEDGGSTLPVWNGR